MKRIAAILTLLFAAASGEAAAAVVWTCEVLHVYDLGAGGAHERDAAGTALGNRFTANDETGEVSGRLLGQPQEWKAVPRRFGPDKDGLQSIRSSGGRQLMHLYVETFATGPAKPFVITELDIGASRTGLCRAGR